MYKIVLTKGVTDFYFMYVSLIIFYLKYRVN